MSLNVNACDWYCSDCNDCIEKINSASEGQTICLSASIINHGGTCINNPVNFNNKIFDCRGYKIDGWGGGYGIYLNGKQNNTIKNCIITDFWRGISLYFSSNNTLTNNTANNNEDYGIYLYYSSNNTLTNNTANNNEHGIYFGYGSNNNTMISNNMCNNSRYDVYVSILNSATGDNNTCAIFYNYNDVNSIRCDYTCLIDNCNCSTCRECNYKLSHPSCSQVNLIANIINHPETCINNPTNFNNKIFDCQGNIIDGTWWGWWWGWWGYGIYLHKKFGNTIKNCIITDFRYGIRLEYSSNNVLINNIANNNTRDGIHLWNSSKNALTNNTANNNRDDGIYLFRSSNNILINNTMNNNTYNFNIDGWEISHFYQDINTSNTVNGKPIYYWTNEKNAPNNCRNAEINETTNAGFVALVSCENITVRNLNLTKNSHGILIVNTTNSKILNNTANNNSYGLFIRSSSNNDLISNTIMNNKDIGIYFSYDANDNNLTSNRICGNKVDVREYGTNHGSNNTCNTTQRWSDIGYLSCQRLCNGSEGEKPDCLCSSCDECTKELNSNCLVVNLTKNIINHSRTCIDNPPRFNNKTFDCQKRVIDSDYRHFLVSFQPAYGIHIDTKENNTIKNCIITDFYTGIYLYSSSNNNITNNVVNSNEWGGIRLDYSSNNTLLNNTASSLDSRMTTGILLWQSSNNTIINNTANSNGEGIYLSMSHNNTIIGNTVESNYVGRIVRKYYDPFGRLIKTITRNLKGVGVYLYSSSNNILINNTASNNRWNGIILYSSNYNTLTNNTANNNDYGIYLSNSSNNNITNNGMNNNRHGIYLENANNNNFTLNTVKFNQRHGFRALATSTDNNLITNTFCSNNQSGGGWYDIRDDDANSGSNNTCDTVYNWNDTGRTGCTYPCTIVHGVNNTNIRNATVPAGQTGNITYRICNNGTVNNVLYNFMNETGCPGFNITLPASITLNRGQCQEVNVSVSTPAGSPLICNVLLNVSNATYGVWATAMGHITTTLQPTGKANDIFDAIEMLEYLSGEKNLARGTDYYDLNDDKTVNLLDVFILIDKILT